MDEVFRLMSTIGVDLDQYERDLKSAEAKTRNSAKAMENALSDIDVKFDFGKQGKQIEFILKRAKELNLSVSQFAKSASGDFLNKDAVAAAKALEQLGKAREKALGGSGSSASSEGLLRQLDQLRIGASQLGRGSLGGLPNVIKAYAVSADEGAIATGALSTRALTLGIVAGGTALAVVAAGAGMVKLANDSAEAGRALEKLQDQTGLSADRVQFLQAAAHVTGVELNTLTQAFEGYKNAAREAQLGNEDLQKIFKALGVTTKQINEETFESLIQRLKEVKDETLRNEAAQKLQLGSIQSLIRYYDELNASGGKLKNQIGEVAQKMGTEAQEEAKKYSQNIALLEERFDQLKFSIGNGALPVFNAWLDALQNGPSGIELMNQALDRLLGRYRALANTPPPGTAFFKDGVRPADGYAGREVQGPREVYGPIVDPKKIPKVKSNVNETALRGALTSGGSNGGGRSRGRGASDADAAAKALLALQKTQNEAFLKLEQDRIKRELDLNAESLNNNLRYTNDSISVLNKYYDERIKLQQDSISAEIENEQKYFLQLQQEQDKAVKQSEKLRIQAEKERVKEKLAILNRDFFTVGDKENSDRQNKVREETKRQNDEVAKLVGGYRKLQDQLTELNGSDYEKFLVNLNNTTEEVQKLALLTGRVDILKGLQAFRDAATQRFKEGQVTKRGDIIGAGLDLERTQVQRQLDLGSITEGQARKQILAIETRVGDQLRENLKLQIAIAEANGDQLKALALRKELEDASLLGIDQEKIRRFKQLKTDIGSAIDDARKAIINGEVGILDGLRNLAKSISNTFFDELERTLIEKVTGGKFSSVGEVLGDAIGNLFGKVLGLKPSDKKDPVQAAVEKQTEALSNLLHEQVHQSQQALGKLQEMADCSCAAASQASTPSLGRSILNGAISGAVSGLISGIAGGGFGGDGGGETVEPSLAGNPGYSNIGSRVPLFIKKRARGGRFNAFDTMMTGENGVELIQPDFGGNVVQNADAARAMGSGGGLTVTNNFHITSTDGKFSRAAQQQVALAASQGLQRAYKRGR